MVIIMNDNGKTNVICQENLNSQYTSIITPIQPDSQPIIDDKIRYMTMRINALHKAYNLFSIILFISTLIIFFLLIVNITKGYYLLVSGLLLIWAILTYTLFLLKRKEIDTDEVVLDVLKK